MGRLKASMPTKCMDQMPRPMAQAPPNSQKRAAAPRADVTRLAMPKAV